MSAPNPPTPSSSQPSLNANADLDPQVLLQQQHRIFKIAIQDLPPRLIEIHQCFAWSATHQQNVPVFYSPCRVPDILQLAHEVDPSMLTPYEWSFGIKGIQGDAWEDKILINWEKDVIFFGKEVIYRDFQIGFIPTRDRAMRYQINGLDKVQKMALLKSWWSAPSHTIMATWGALREVVLVTADEDLSSTPRSVVNTSVDMAPFRQRQGWHSKRRIEGSPLLVRPGMVHKV